MVKSFVSFEPTAAVKFHSEFHNDRLRGWCPQDLRYNGIRGWTLRREGRQ